MGEQDQARLSEKLKIDGSRFKARLVLANNTTQLSRQSVEELRQDGVALVNIGGGRFVPAENIVLAKGFDKEEADKLAAKGYKLGGTFRSSVETTAGILLSSAHPLQVMERREKAIQNVRHLAGPPRPAN